MQRDITKTGYSTIMAKLDDEEKSELDVTIRWQGVKTVQTFDQNYDRFCGGTRSRIHYFDAEIDVHYPDGVKTFDVEEAKTRFGKNEVHRMYKEAANF